MLFIFLAGLCANIIFRDKLVFGGVRTRNHFDTIGWAAVTIFQCLTPENVNQVVIDASHGVGYGGGVFVVAMMLIGHYVFEPLFLVIVIANFSDAETNKGMSTVLALFSIRACQCWCRPYRMERR